MSVTHAHQHEGEYFEGSPAIAIEIISPVNRAEVMETKLDLYFEHGALEVWVAYPKQKRIIVYLRDSYRRYSENESLSTALLPGFEIKVASVFV